MSDTKKSLDGKSALVTGGSRGIGQAIAMQFARSGAQVAIIEHPEVTPLADVCAALQQAGSPEARVFPADLADPGATRAAVDAVQGWTTIDILVNNAGIQAPEPLECVSRTNWDRIIAVNLSAAFDTMRLLMPPMAQRGFGRVINISSVHGLVASIEKAAYVSSKFALLGLTRVAALEYAAVGSAESGGVTANCLCPGWTETALIGPQIDASAAAAGGDRDAGIRTLLAQKQPSLRLTEVDDIAAAALWLCAREAHNITGVALPIDGGWTAQ